MYSGWECLKQLFNIHCEEKKKRKQILNIKTDCK